MKNSTDGDSHEGRKRERTVESRRKTRSVTKPPRFKRENSSVENGDSMEVSADSTVLQGHAPESEIETPGKLSPAQVRAVQNDFRTGFTVKQIELVTGIRAPTIYKYIKGIEPPIPNPEENSGSNTGPVKPPDPPASSLSQPVVAAQPPRVIELLPEEKETAPSGNGYEEPYRPHSRPSLPVVDSQTITELIWLFGSDMRRRGYTNFLNYFEEYVIPRFEELEFWEGHVPGNSPQEKRHNLTRYLWIASKYFQLQKEHAEYESANNGSGLKEGS